MINKALEFLTEELNEFLALKNGMPGDRKVVLTNVATQEGNWAIPNNKLGLSLINIEEERVMREMVGTYINRNGITEEVNPEVKLNLYILLSANFTSDESQTDGIEYLEGLKQLSYVISFFQSKYKFTNDNSPRLAQIDPLMQQLVVELYSYSFEQLYNFWTVVGAKYLPSVLYRVRLLRFQEGALEAENPTITTAIANTNQRGVTNNT